MKKLLFLCALTWSCIEAQNNRKNVCQSQQCQFSAQIFKMNMNTSVLPCQDFYQFMCGNFKTWNTLTEGRPAIIMTSYRQMGLDQKISGFLSTDIGTNDLSSLKKAKIVYQSCMNGYAMEKFGDIPIPLELNTVGLPIMPPFNRPLNEPLNFSKLLARIHRSPYTNFLFDVHVIGDVKDSTKTRLAFNYTPSINHLKTDKFEATETFQLHSRLSESAELEKKKESNRELLAQVMAIAVKYMNEFTNAPFSKKTNSLIENRIKEAVDFLMKLEETRKLINPEDKYNADPYTYITLDELQMETDEILGKAQIKIDWYYYMQELFEGIHDDTYNFFKNGELILIRNFEQFKAVLRTVSKVSQKVMISAAWWLVVDSVSPYATAVFRSLHTYYTAETGTGQPTPRQWECYTLVKNQFSHLFVHMLIKNDENAFKTRKEVEEMVSNIRAAYHETILQATWLDTGTKMAALHKLKNITQNISFNDWLTDPAQIDELYEDDIVHHDLFYLNIRSGNLDRRKRRLKYLGKENVKSTESTLLDPITVNACYSTLSNSIDVPFGILGPPYYGWGLQALNYGAIGYVLSHEIGHAFDIEGKEYDSWGQKILWWKKKTVSQYHERSKCFVDFFNDFYFPEVKRTVNGNLTLGENIADFLGVQQALKAYRKYVAKHGEEKSLPNFGHLSHEKLLTMAFATMNCSVLAPSHLQHVLETDEHSPNKARVLGVLKNSYEFASIWKCSINQEMNPKKKCVLW